jgi:hypothetical protein
LLIALCQQGAFTLPAERAKQWYGVSADTVEKGFGLLRDRKIIARAKDWRISRYAPGGLAPTNVYRLRPPFATGREVELRVVS